MGIRAKAPQGQIQALAKNRGRPKGPGGGKRGRPEGTGAGKRGRPKGSGAKRGGSNLPSGAKVSSTPSDVKAAILAYLESKGDSGASSHAIAEHLGFKPGLLLGHLVKSGRVVAKEGKDGKVFVVGYGRRVADKPGQGRLALRAISCSGFYL